MTAFRYSSGLPGAPPTDMYINVLLVAIAPTATIASIAGCYECIEPQVSNLFKRETLSGEFLQVNGYKAMPIIRGSREFVMRTFLPMTTVPVHVYLVLALEVHLRSQVVGSARLFVADLRRRDGLALGAGDLAEHDE